MRPIHAFILSINKDTVTILKKFEEENSIIMEIIGVADTIGEAVTEIASKNQILLFWI